MKLMQNQLLLLFWSFRETIIMILPIFVVEASVMAGKVSDVSTRIHQVLHMAT